MFTIIAFILVIAGAVNWLTIGMLQYDYVAGIFGTQSNIFSRLIYAIIGIAGVYLFFCALFRGGKLHLSLRKAKNKMDEKRKQEYRKEFEQEYRIADRDSRD